MLPVYVVIDPLFPSITELGNYCTIDLVIKCFDSEITLVFEEASGTEEGGRYP